MMRKVKNIAYWLFAVGYLVTALSFISGEINGARCRSVEVRILDETGNRFVDKNEVLNIITDAGIRLMNQPFDSINLDRLEALITRHPQIRGTEVYGTPSGQLRIDIDQRSPAVRIVNMTGESYYIDTDGMPMKLSDKYTSHVLVANGRIEEPYSALAGKNMGEMEAVSPLAEKFVADDIFRLAMFIRADPFWNAQIDQVFINRKREIELIPMVGAHVIILGTTDEIEEKFENLEMLYRRGLSKVGWTKYSTINLKYKNQVVCTKR
ncbi:MAG: hypothetical protein KJ607_05550 [Bacteroidetes bacterium]|nr:hypothetical protein [Bacteroidota bacterium]